MTLDRPSAEALLFEWAQGEGLRSHARGVEASMRAYARKFGEDEALWGATGLLHDLDYEKHPSPGGAPSNRMSDFQGKRIP